MAKSLTQKELDNQSENIADYPSMGVFKTAEPLILTPYPNGGWTISSRGPDQYMMGAEVGAYSSAKDMLAALKEHLDR